MRYFRPQSLTWWAGVLAVALGVLQAAEWSPDPAAYPGAAGIVTAITQALTALTGGGDASPAGLIVLGMGLIGIRDKMQREAERADGRYHAQMAIAAASDASFFEEYEAAPEDELDPDEEYDPNANLPPGESPFPAGVVDPYGPGGSR